MKPKLLNALLIATSLLGYLEWGGGNSTFLFQAEWALITKMIAHPADAIHPFTVLPLLGQSVLVFTLFQKSPSRAITFIGLTGIGILLGFMFIVGVMSLNYKVALSTLPYLTVATITVMHHSRKATKR